MRNLCTMLVAALLMTACSTLPQDGPDAAKIYKNANNRATYAEYAAAKRQVDMKTDYVVVPVNETVAAYLSAAESPVSSGVFSGRSTTPPIRIGVGDVVSVTIFEADSGGLFIPRDGGTRPGNFVQIPNQRVDEGGTISVPFAGQIRVLNQTPVAVENTIQSRLADQAIQPQVVVSVVEQRSAQVSVLGTVNLPTVFSLDNAGTRILDAIARAGGIQGESYESVVTLQRRGVQRSTALTTLVNSPNSNIYLEPGDTIYVVQEPRTFSVVGASGEAGRYSFDAQRLTVADALSRAGGLLDNRANPAYVFLYRMESRSTLQQLGVNLSKVPGGDTVATIYNFNLRDPGGFFLATRASVKNDDLLYVANAESVELAKALQIFRLGVAGIREGTAGGRDIGL